MEWLDSHQSEEVEVYDAKIKECEGIANPIMTKMYQEASGGQMPVECQMPASESSAGGATERKLINKIHGREMLILFVRNR